MESLPWIDWDVAAAVGRTVVPPGPALTDDQVREGVSGQRAAAAAVTDPIRRVTGLAGPAASTVVVVDRPGWVASNAAMARALLDRTGGPQDPDSIGRRVGGRLLALEAGLVFGWVATRVLGQFDPFGQPNRLLLVAPNIMAAERALRVPPDDFRLWVCLHEETHRFQFGHAPWLRDHLIDLFRELLTSPGPSFAAWRPGNPGLGVADLLVTPSQRAAFDQLTAVMSLLEGHADVIMDAAAEGLVRSVGRLRSLFEQRRDRPGWHQLMSRLLGLNLKRDQYREGSAFCRKVIAVRGVAGLNEAFGSPGLLPSLTEIRDPQQWIHRMAG